MPRLTAQQRHDALLRLVRDIETLIPIHFPEPFVPDPDNLANPRQTRGGFTLPDGSHFPIFTKRIFQDGTVEYHVRRLSADPSNRQCFPTLGSRKTIVNQHAWIYPVPTSDVPGFVFEGWKFYEYSCSQGAL